MQHLQYLITDMDGVLWHGDTPMPGLVDFFETLHERNIQLMCATNNASKTPEQYVEKLAKFGVAVTPQQIMTSALATAAYVTQHYPASASIYCIGGDGLRQALQQKGLHLLERNDDHTAAELVVVGLHTGVTYEDFAIATLHIRRGATFIGCNPDTTFPSERGLLPGNGSLLALLTAATDQKPVIIGKPHPPMFLACLHQWGPQATGQNSAMLGDRIGTDIVGAHQVGLQTILVLSGVSTAAELAQSNTRPDYVFSDISALRQALQTSPLSTNV